MNGFQEWEVSGVSTTNHDASFSALSAPRWSDVLPLPSRGPPAAHYGLLDKLSAHCVSETALAIRVYKNQIARGSVTSFSCLVPNACQAQSRGHGGSHEMHQILTYVTKEQSPDNWHVRCVGVCARARACRPECTRACKELRDWMHCRE